MMPRWKTPVELEPQQQRRAELHLERLTSQVLRRWEREANGFGFMEGKVGVAFALFELASAGRSDTADHAARALAAAVDQFNAVGANASLHSGIAGLGWLIDAWVGDEDLCGPIDQSLTTHVNEMASANPVISLRHGLAGIGLYAARRAPRVATAHVLLKAVLSRLTEAAQVTPEGVTWNTPYSYFMNRDGGSVFASLGEHAVIREWGVAHGVASVVLLQSQSNTGPLRDALRWMWNSTQPESNRFGWVWADGERARLNVAAWCTGDHGVALSCWLAATVADLPDEATQWLRFGRVLAQRVIDGERPAVQKRLDLCCGLSGVLQGFSSWAALTGDPLFADAARACLNRVLDELEPVELEKESVMFQFGLSGIAAALLSMTSRRAPAWAGLLAMAL